jgi:hypothetical protein
LNRASGFSVIPALVVAVESIAIFSPVPRSHPATSQARKYHGLEPHLVNPAEVVLARIPPDKPRDIGFGEPGISSVRADGPRPSQEAPPDPAFDPLMMHAEDLSEIADAIGFPDASRGLPSLRNAS